MSPSTQAPTIGRAHPRADPGGHLNPQSEHPATSYVIHGPYGPVRVPDLRSKYPIPKPCGTPGCWCPTCEAASDAVTPANALLLHRAASELLDWYHDDLQNLRDDLPEIAQTQTSAWFRNVAGVFHELQKRIERRQSLVPRHTADEVALRLTLAALEQELENHDEWQDAYGLRPVLEQHPHHEADGDLLRVSEQLMLDQDVALLWLIDGPADATAEIGYPNLNPDQWFVPRCR